MKISNQRKHGTRKGMRWKMMKEKVEETYQATQAGRAFYASLSRTRLRRASLVERMTRGMRAPDPPRGEN
jgi:hypothetical protein